jgi:hypothetical protein
VRSELVLDYLDDVAKLAMGGDRGDVPFEGLS